MHNSKRPITIIDGVCDDAKGINIHDVGERFSLVTHLAVNAIGCFFTPFDANFNAAFFQCALE